MTILKKASIAAISLALAGSVFAMGKPQEHGYWIAGFELGYLQPSVQGLDNTYFAHSCPSGACTIGALINAAGVGTINYREENVGLDYDFSYKGILGYRFPASHNELYATYEYLNSDETNTPRANTVFSWSPVFHTLTLLSVLNQFRGFTSLIGGPLSFNTFATAKLESKLHNVNLLGQTSMDFGHWVTLQPYAGIQFSYAENDLDADGGFNASLGPSNPLQSTINVNANEWASFRNKFWALGPKLGANMVVHLHRNVDMVLGGGLGLLFGQTESQYNSCFVLNANSAASGLFTPIQVGLNYNDIHRSTAKFLPSVSGKLELRMHFNYNKTIIELAGGYRGEIWYHAADNNALVDEQENIAGQFFGLTVTHTTRERSGDYTVQGPFLRIAMYFPTNYFD